MVTIPESMDALVYFTRRTIGKGKAMAWAYKIPCPKCKKGIMSKPKDEKTGKVKIRATAYVCESCLHSIEKGEYEDMLTCEIVYTCPKCLKSGEAEVSFKRKKVALVNEETGKKSSVPAVVFNCKDCDEKIAITRKMK